MVSGFFFVPLLLRFPVDSLIRIRR